ncbi:hypothetical protein Tco_0748156 [Tanacetum coccineum]|uniref:Reverse transcriptase Ty1/copia-type domain-containing protein n=1 Tax=Tanacetum coccineum TaxID=301880 RepID=A0ABQ4YV10_9ASTR
METQKPLLKDEDGEEVDVHMYRSMISSLMYLTSSRPDIIFAVCACAKYQVNPKISHLHSVKRIFRYLKGQPKLGLWYPKDSPFDLVAYTDSDYAGTSLDRKSTTGGKAKKNVKLIMEKLFRMELELMLVTQSGGPRCQETMGDTIAQTRFEGVSKHSNDSLLVRGNTLRSDEDRLKLDELMATNLGEDASKQGRIDVIDANEEITLVSVQNVDEEMFDVNVLDGEEVFVAEQEVAVKDVSNVVSTAGDATTVSAATTTTATITTVDDITLAQALMEIKSTKPKEKGVVKQELGESRTTISSQLSSQQSHDKGKGILIEHVKPMKKKDLIRLDEEVALKLQAKIDADHQLAKRLQAQEQEELSIEEKATLFQQLLEKRRKHFAAKRAEEKRNKPPIKSQQRKIMVNTFEDFRTELVEGKEKRARTELIQENATKQKVKDDKETAELKQCLEIIPDEEEVTIDGIPLAVKSTSIVGWKIHKERGTKTGVSTAQRLQRKYAKCLLLLVHNCSAEVNAASENMLEVTTASEYQVNAAS